MGIVLLLLLLTGELQARIEYFPHGFDSAKRSEPQVYGYQLMPQYQDSTSQSEVLNYHQQYPHIHFVNPGSHIPHNQPRYIPQLGNLEIDNFPQLPVYQQNLQSRGPNIFQREKVKTGNYQQRFQRHAPNHYQEPHPQAPSLNEYSGLQANTNNQKPQPKAPKHYEQLPTQKPAGHIGKQKPKYSRPSYQEMSLLKMPSNYQGHEAHGLYQNPESQVQIYQESPSNQASNGYQRTRPQAMSLYQEPIPEPQPSRHPPRSQLLGGDSQMAVYRNGRWPKSPSHRLKPQEPASQVQAYQQRSQPHHFHAPRNQQTNKTQEFHLQKRTLPQMSDNNQRSWPLKRGLQKPQPQAHSHYHQVFPHNPGLHGSGYQQISQFQAPSNQQRLQLQMLEQQDQDYRAKSQFQAPSDQERLQMPGLQGQGYQPKSQFQAPGHQPVQETQRLESINLRKMQSKGPSDHQTPDPQVPSYQQNPQFYMLSHQDGTSPQMSMPQAPHHYNQHQPLISEPYKTGHGQNFHHGSNYQRSPRPHGIIGHQQWPLTQMSQGSSYQQHFLPQRSQSYRDGYKQNPSSQMSINQQRPQPYRSDNQHNLPKTHAPNPQAWG